MGKYDVGTVHKTNEGYNIMVVEYIDYDFRNVVFLDEYSHTVVTRITNIGRGNISNPYHRSLYNIGYRGVGAYKTKQNNKITKVYNTWVGMYNRLEICHNYTNVTICDEWHNFQNFGEWFDDNYIEGFHLDKDLLQQGVENKIYSPSTCIFLPSSVNSFISTNIQSTNKSGYVGVNKHKVTGKWVAQIRDFNLKKPIHLGLFDNIEEASIVYQKARKIQAEKVKDYMRSLGYYSEEIIQLIK